MMLQQKSPMGTLSVQRDDGEHEPDAHYRDADFGPEMHDEDPWLLENKKFFKQEGEAGHLLSFWRMAITQMINWSVFEKLP